MNIYEIDNNPINIFIIYMCKLSIMVLEENNSNINCGDDNVDDDDDYTAH